MLPDCVGATLFELFFTYFQRRIVQDRFDPATAALVSGGAHGLAALLIQEDTVGWFGPGGRERAILDAFESAVNWLKDNVGYEMGEWTWGKLHTMPLRHVLSGRGDLGPLLDQPGGPVRGTSITVCNTGPGGPRYEAKMGAGYRLIADLAESGLHAIDAQSQSGHPASPHYADQLQQWIDGSYHYLPLDRGEVEKAAVTTLTLVSG
jgi:penicillin amidase